MPESVLVTALGLVLVLSGYVHQLFFTRPQAAARIAYVTAGVLSLIVVGIHMAHGALDAGILREIEGGKIEAAAIREYVISKRDGARVPGYFIVALCAFSVELIAAMRFMPYLVRVDGKPEA